MPKTLRLQIIASKSNVAHADGRGRRFPWAGATVTLQLGEQQTGPRGGQFYAGPLRMSKRTRGTRKGQFKMYEGQLQNLLRGFAVEFRADVCGQRGLFLGNAKVIA